MVSGVDCAPVFEACEHVLDLVALLIKLAIVRVLDFSGAVRRDTWLDATFGQSLADPAGVIGSVGEHGGGGWQCRDQSGSGLELTGLPFGQNQAHRTALAVAHGMQLGRQPTPAPADISG